MSELGGHRALLTLFCKQGFNRRPELFGQALKHASAWHVLVRLVSPKRVRTNPDPLRKINLRQASAYTSLA